MDGSQDTYLSHLAQYYIWCEEHDQDFWHIPTSYFLVCCWIIDSCTRGIKKGTIRGYRASIKWMNDMLGYTGTAGEGWNPKHNIISRLGQYANRFAVGPVNNGAMNLTQEQVKWLWDLYINDSYNNKVRVISFVIGILLGARPNWVWKVYNKKKGIRLKHVRFLYTKEDTGLWNKYGLALPLTMVDKVRAIKFNVPNVKGKPEGTYLTKYLGRTGVKGYDPVYELAKVLCTSGHIMVNREDDYLFRLYNGKPVNYDDMFRWVLLWREEVKGLTHEQRLRVRLHTIRKTFANLAFGSGMDMLAIATYGYWAIPTAMIVYVQFNVKEAMRIPYRLLLQKPKRGKDKRVDMNKLYKFTY